MRRTFHSKEHPQMACTERILLMSKWQCNIVTFVTISLHLNIPNNIEIFQQFEYVAVNIDNVIVTI